MAVLIDGCEVCVGCFRVHCAYVGNEAALMRILRIGKCPFNPPKTEAEKARLLNPMKASRRSRKAR